MSSGQSEFVTTAELTRLARMNASGAVPEESRQSLPVPVQRPEGLRILFMFAPSQASPTEGVRMAPPNYVARMEPGTGKLEELRAVGPSDFGQSHGENDVIGAYVMPEGMTVDEYLETRDRLYAVYDLLLPAFAAGRAAATPDLKEAALEFRKLFSAMSEPPLSPYYSALGKDFFAWVARLVR